MSANPAVQARRDQYGMAVAQATEYRDACAGQGRLILSAAGPLADTLIHWKDTTPVRGCVHLTEPDHLPIVPLFGQIAVAGYICCAHCADRRAQALLGDDCAGCGAPMPPERGGDGLRYMTVVGLLPALTLLGEVCDDCRNLCNIDQPEGESE